MSKNDVQKAERHPNIMDDKNMPDVVYLLDDNTSIGDMGFTTTEYKEGWIQYIRADLASQTQVNVAPEPTTDEKRVMDMMAEVLKDIVDVTAQCDGYESCQKDDFSQARKALAEYEDLKNEQ